MSVAIKAHHIDIFIYIDRQGEIFLAKPTLHLYGRDILPHVVVGFESFHYQHRDLFQDLPGKPARPHARLNNQRSFHLNPLILTLFCFRTDAVSAGVPRGQPRSMTDRARIRLGNLSNIPAPVRLALNPQPRRSADRV